jgi:hypothetical protein
MSLSAQQRQLLEALRKKKQQQAERPRPDRLPMSFTQLRAWYLDRMAPGAAHYLIPLAFRIEGPLDRDALHRALNALVARHESLRTTFAMDEDGPYQIVAASLAIDLADAADGTPMDLTTGPLIRAHLEREGADRHVLHLTLHHIVADAWSLDVLRRELGALYDGRELPALSRQYPDYAIWQRENDYGRDLDFWREALAGAPPISELPADLPRPAVQTYAGAELPFSLDLPREEFRAYCRSLGATPYMVLLAAYLVVLSRRSGLSSSTSRSKGIPWWSWASSTASLTRSTTSANDGSPDRSARMARVLVKNPIRPSNSTLSRLAMGVPTTRSRPPERRESTTR